jgi:hypothetical protein
MNGKTICESKNIQKLTKYGKISVKEEEFLYRLVKQYGTYIYTIHNVIYIVEFQNSKFAKDLQKKLVNEFGYKQNANYYYKRI